MAKSVEIRNISPLGDLEVPLLGQVVKHGQTVAVPAAAAERLLAQTGNFQPAAGQTGGQAGQDGPPAQHQDGQAEQPPAGTDTTDEGDQA